MGLVPRAEGHHTEFWLQSLMREVEGGQLDLGRAPALL